MYSCYVHHTIPAALRVTPAVESLVEPIGTNLTLNCSSSEGGVISWSVQLPDEDIERSSTDPAKPLPPNMRAVDDQQLHITATLETNGSVIRCVNFVDGSPRPLLSDSITAVFYGQLPQNTHEETQ
jgi:hypothetical protein